MPLCIQCGHSGWCGIHALIKMDVKRPGSASSAPGAAALWFGLHLLHPNFATSGVAYGASGAFGQGVFVALCCPAKASLQCFRFQPLTRCNVLQIRQHIGHLLFWPTAVLFRASSMLAHCSSGTAGPARRCQQSMVCSIILVLSLHAVVRIPAVCRLWPQGNW